MAGSEGRPAGNGALDGGAPAGAITDVEKMAAGTPGQQGSIEKMTLVGCAAFLMMNTPTHKHVFISDLEWCVIPPIALGQFHLWRRQGVPVGFASWAFLSEAAEARVRSGSLRLAPDDWNSGDRLWLIDFVMPFGGQQEGMMDLRNRVLAGKKVMTVQRSPDGGLSFTQWGA